MPLQVPEEKIESVVKQHMVHKLTDDVHTSGAVTHAAALRRYASAVVSASLLCTTMLCVHAFFSMLMCGGHCRRFEHVALLW